MLTVRELARKFVECALKGEESSFDSSAPELLNPEDRGLFQELSQGVLREWLYLDYLITRLAKRKPTADLQLIIALAAYQVLFLDRVPDYAIFSEMKKMTAKLRLSDAESGFAHAIVKSIERDRPRLLERRSAALEKLRAGTPPEAKDAEAWAVLNAPSALLDAHTILEGDVKKKAARERGTRALALMKERPKLVGYVLPGQKPMAAKASLESSIAPAAVIFEPGPELLHDLSAGRARIQGEASQWSCELAAKILLAAGRGPVRVLEMAAGKGGKLLGTLAAAARLAGGANKLPEIEWVAADSSSEQLELLESDALPVAQELFKSVKIDIRRHDWREKFDLGGPFDLVWLDAPCTGFGTLSKLPQIALTRGETAYDEAKTMAEIQKRLSTAGLQHKKPGGVFFFSVCTLTRPETLDMAKFLEEQLGRKLEFSAALWPGDEHGARTAEGFYCAYGK